MSDKTLLLVDGSSYLYRAYHALPDLRGPGGIPTGAIHGVVAMMKRLREQHPAARGACVFDAKGPTFRDAWYPAYKAQRSAMPADLVLQIEPIHEAVQLLGWPVLSVPGIEADDAIGTLCVVGVAAGYDVIVSTGDKDLAQLVNDHVTLINTMSNERLDAAAVLAKFGVGPQRIVDYLALVGDTVDNVPGVEKVGPKTAAKWIAEYGSLAGVMAAAPSIKGAAGEHLRQALEWLPLGQRLVTVLTDADLSGQLPGWPGLDALALRALDAPGLLAFYERHGFKTFKRELELAAGAAAPGGPGTAAVPGDGPGAPAAAPRAVRELHYDTVLSETALQGWIARIEAAPLVAIDTETDSLDGMRARIVGISLSDAPGATATPARRNSCRPSRCWRGSNRGSKTPRARNWARTSSTTRTCSPTPASRCAATPTTRCCKATCWRPTSPTGWPAWRCATWGVPA